MAQGDVNTEVLAEMWSRWKKPVALNFVSETLDIWLHIAVEHKVGKIWSV